MNDADVLEQLKWAVQALGAPAIAQLKLFPDFTVKADELALDFDHWYAVVQSRDTIALSDQQIAALANLDNQFETMSGWSNESQEELWTEHSVSSAPEWRQVRALARIALSSFGWPNKTPPDNRSTYVPGDSGT